VFALRWPHVLLNDDGTGLIQIVEGRSKAARRVLPMTPRAHALLLARWAAAGKPEDGSLFPARTNPAKHISDALTKGQHKQALEASGVSSFVPYSMRHTALTRFGEAAGNNIFTVAQIAGHACLTTTKRYVHPLAEAINRVFHGVNPKNETVKEGTLCRKGTASGKETVFGTLPAGGSGATERLRKHRGTSKGAGGIAATALALAR
jgi:site-specific recombinase XerC